MQERNILKMNLIVKILFDEKNRFIGTYDEITTNLNASKPTVVNTFKVLIEDGILSRVKNGQYELLSKITA